MQTIIERPAESAGELYYKTPVTPEEAFQAIGRLRKEARDEIDRLIRFLDETDNHMELEEAVDDVACDDNELDGSNVDGEGEDDEPALGFLENHPLSYGLTDRDNTGNQDTKRACAGLGDDLEDEHDGREQDSEDEGAQCEDEGSDTSDKEPSLGWGIDGELGNAGGADRELQDHAPVRPQRRTRLGKGIHAAPNYCHGNRILGLSKEQAARIAPLNTSGLRFLRPL